MIRRILPAIFFRVVMLAIFLPPIYAVCDVFLRSPPVRGYLIAEAATILTGVVAAAAAVVAVVRGPERRQVREE
jgi:hypothetical protein